jgi:nitroreductase
VQKLETLMSIKNNFFLKRRSVVAKKMSADPINEKDLNSILQAGIRVPDNGALSPWKLKIIQGKTLKQIDESVILPQFLKNNPEANEATKEVESKRLQRAGAVVVVLSTPIEHPSIPSWERQLSSGAVCMNLLSCAQSMGYAAQWLTEWYSYNDYVLSYLGGKVGTDRISGFIYIGHKIDEPNERRRPDPATIISYI